MFHVKHAIVLKKKFLLLGSMDRTAKLWHMEYTHPLRVYAGHEQDVDVVKFHPNCNYVATGGSDKTIRLWSHSDAKMVSTGSFSSFKLTD